MICRQLDMTRKRLQLHWIEQYFIERNSKLDRYLFDRFTASEHANLINFRQAFFGSGLRLTVAVLNSIVSALFGYILSATLLAQSIFVSAVVAIVVSLISYFLQSLDYHMQSTKNYQRWQKFR